MPQCPHCQSNQSEGAKFCSACGAALLATSQASRLHPRSQLANVEEEVLWRGSFSAKGLIHAWLLALLVTVALPLGGWATQADRYAWSAIGGGILLVWCGLLAWLIYEKLNVSYELTNLRLIHRSGILLRRTDRIELIDMNDVSHEQGIVERIFHVGTIEVTSSDRSHPVIVLAGIENVEQVAMLIDDARLRERARRGVHVEQI